MKDGDDPGNAFAIPDLWASSKYFPESGDSYSFLFSQLKVDDISEKLPEQSLSHGGGNFFALADFPFENPEPSIISTSTPPPLSERGEEINNEADDGYVDIWSFAPEEELKSANYLTWDAFDEQREEAPQTCYVSEGGPQLFDAAVADDTSPLQIDNQDAVVVSGSTYASSLLALGLGRDSVLFTWNEETKEFECTLKSVRTSGCSTELTHDVTALFLRCGNTTKALRSFTDKAYLKHRSPGRIALADAIGTVLSTLQSHLNIPASSLQSILKLQSLFRPVSHLLTIFHELIVAAGSAQNDEVMLSNLLQFIEQTEHRTDSTQTILLEVLSRVSRPFLDFAGEWLGIQRETGMPLVKGSVGKSFVKAEDRLWIDEQGMEIRTPDFVLDEARVPSFMPEGDMQILFEAGRSLRLLREHQPEHPLARGDFVTTAAAKPVLEWEFSWRNIEAIGERARQYEKDLTAAIEKYSTSGTTTSPPCLAPPAEEKEELNLFGKPAEEMQAHLLASLNTLTTPPLTPTSTLTNLLTTHLTTAPTSSISALTPLPLPLPLTPHLSLSPLLTPLSTHLSHATLSLLLRSNLSTHLSLHRSFSLLGSGVFASRLAHALFDPDLGTAERQRGVVREGVMGLRLGGRGRWGGGCGGEASWPPGGSELRLVLSGVLSESYAATTPRAPSRPSTSSSSPAFEIGGRVGTYTAPTMLPGDLSFGVRHMTSAEIGACLDPSSLSALDFLRLVYKPPAPLDAVITPESLHMYDRAFGALLRCLRVRFVMGELFRASKTWKGRSGRCAARFRNEAQHVVNAICSHFESGVTAAWGVMEAKMREVEECLQPGGVGLAAGEGVEGLRRYHERVLERMMGVLFLRGRQSVVRGVLEGVLGCVLGFGGGLLVRAVLVMRGMG
ncbi:hypothetical protein GMDG_06442 [Pseudogymnoascus destructans 20631-21]|uniref:Spindle pole body component n=1 Tax=Pseudogymnoascus destructans (strain ATCC MYA-4855 / 20631-21) TaxID=658429 RepID=L8FTU1_PSED2|nr:hypothetical protein GMDG_06442 [Pseudogymnoascus destructans 20631-21]